VLPAVKNGYFLREIADASFTYQREVEQNQRVKVGVNGYTTDEKLTIPILNMDEQGERRHLDRLNRVRRDRDSDEVQRRLDDLREAARGTDNLMPYLLEAARAYATLGEMTDVFREVFGEAEVLTVA
jgi:methylmalonyl-CoA mutase N-terminal domain/subunit